MSAVDTVPARPPAQLPTGIPATEPPEARGLARDEVRLLVAGAGPIQHRLFADIGRFLQSGDVVVVNTSATLPAALDGRRTDGTAVRVHVSGPHDGCWLVELRTPAGRRFHDASRGDVIALPRGARLTLEAAHPDPTRQRGSRLWAASFDASDSMADVLAHHGRPVTYDYLNGAWPLAAYQTIFASEPGSAEMPSAGRPFSAAVVVDLVRRGVAVLPVTLHTGLSSLETGEPPLPERYVVPAATARIVNATRRAGGRIVATGTTVTRALETVADRDGSVRPGAGWTELVLGPQRPARVVNGLVTGWHDADSSHLALLEAVAGRELVAEAYTAAAAERYRWHEFGDACLLLAG